MVAVNRLQATVTRVHTETGEEVCISIPHEEEMIPTPYDEYLQDTLEVCTLEEVEDLLTYEPNETECEIWGITPEECTRALQEAAEILRKQSKCKKLEDAL